MKTQKVKNTAKQTDGVVVTPAQRIRTDWKNLMRKISYHGILTNIPYIAFLALLAIIYIANGHRAVATQRELNIANAQLKELKWQAIDIKTKLMNAGTETDIIRRAAPYGLKPLALPAYAIEIDSTKKSASTN